MWRKKSSLHDIDKPKSILKGSQNQEQNNCVPGGRSSGKKRVKILTYRNEAQEYEEYLQNQEDYLKAKEEADNQDSESPPKCCVPVGCFPCRKDRKIDQYRVEDETKTRESSVVAKIRSNKVAVASDSFHHV